MGLKCSNGLPGGMEGGAGGPAGREGAGLVEGNRIRALSTKMSDRPMGPT